MIKYQLNVSVENITSGRKSHGAIYPMFSKWIPNEIKNQIFDDGENFSELKIRRLTITDGTFQQASRKIGYTGQHTTIEGINDKTNEEQIINTMQRFFYGSLFSRNKYGSTKRSFRIDLLNETIQYQRSGKWMNFNPSNYID